MTKLQKRSLLLGSAVACAALGSTAAFAANAHTAKYTCKGSQVKLFSDYNGGAVSNGGTPPSFSTKGKAYCLVWIQTYHWNNGMGATPGKLGLTGTTTVTSRKASNVPSGSVKNAGWIVNFSASKPVVINGHYSCKDSSPATWAQDTQSKGKGFCAVEVMPAKK